MKLVYQKEGNDDEEILEGITNQEDLIAAYGGREWGLKIY